MLLFSLYNDIYVSDGFTINDESFYYGNEAKWTNKMTGSKISKLFLRFASSDMTAIMNFFLGEWIKARYGRWPLTYANVYCTLQTSKIELCLYTECLLEFRINQTETICRIVYCFLKSLLQNVLAIIHSKKNGFSHRWYIPFSVHCPINNHNTLLCVLGILQQLQYILNHDLLLVTSKIIVNGTIECISIYFELRLYPWLQKSISIFKKS